MFVLSSHRNEGGGRGGGVYWLTNLFISELSLRKIRIGTCAYLRWEDFLINWDFINRDYGTFLRFEILIYFKKWIVFLIILTERKLLNDYLICFRIAELDQMLIKFKMLTYFSSIHIDTEDLEKVILPL